MTGQGVVRYGTVGCGTVRRGLARRGICIRADHPGSPGINGAWLG